MANHEQDQSAGTGPAGHAGEEPGVPDAGRGQSGAGATWGSPGTHGDDGHGTFRWPSSGLPRLFGQHSAPGASAGSPDSAAYPESVGHADGTGYGAETSAQRMAAETGRPLPGQQVGASGPAGGGDAGVPPLSAPEGFGFTGDDDLRDPYGSPEGYDDAEDYEPSGDFPLPQAGDEPVAGYDPVAGDVTAGGGAPAATPPGPPPQSGPWRAATADSLTADLLLPARRHPPSAGLPRAVYRASGGLVRLPPSAAERRRRDQVRRALTPVAGGHHRVAVLSLKGGVGKTTTVVGLGSVLASMRGDRVIALDANPDRGTLCDKLRLETSATVRDLLDERERVRRYADVRAYTTLAPSRLEVLASDRDPAISVAFSADDYTDVAQLLERYYSICITDCGTGLLHSAMAGVLSLADQIILVSTPSVDGARSASATLDWLQAHGYGNLAHAAVVVLSMVRRRSKSTVDTGLLTQHFAARCQAVVQIPYDTHLEEGAEIEIAELDHATADAYLALAAAVGDGFGSPRRVSQRTGGSTALWAAPRFPGG